MAINKEIKAKVDAHAEYCDSIKGYKRIATFLVGDYNYGLELPSSEINTYSIFVPTFNTLIFEKERLSRTHTFPDGSIAYIKDVRSYFDAGLKRQDIRVIETLFSVYANIPEEYQDWVCKLKSLRECIARYNPRRMVKSCLDLIDEYNEDVLFGEDYDCDKLCNMMRLGYFVTLYTQGKDCNECLRPVKKSRNFYLSLKREEVSFYEAKKIVTKLNKVYEDYEFDKEPEEFIKHIVDTNLWRLTSEIFRQTYT